MVKVITVVILSIIGTAFGASPRAPTGLDVATRFSGIPDPFIVGGNTVSGREFPGQVSVQVNNDHICGGSIVNSNYILTAAHCSQLPPRVLSVLSGSNNLSEGGTRRQVTEVHYYETYNDTAIPWHNDIAVMKVDTPFVFDEGTAPVKLPTEGQVTPVGSNATVIGWGIYEYDGPLSDRLQEVNLSISDRDDCNDTYVADGFMVYSDQVCAKPLEWNVGPCIGDTGGPLFVEGTVVGILTWFVGCGIPKYPSIYTQVSFYRDWIDSKVNA